MSAPSLAVFLDFDGTITCRDATDAILESYGDRAWLEIEEAWRGGRIGSRECLVRQMDLVTATAEQMDALLDTIDVDPGFKTLLDVCATRLTPVQVVSDGFDYCIRRILGRPPSNLLARLGETRVVSSSLQADGGRWRARFSAPAEGCSHGCATCKPLAMERAKAAGALTVFVGDGLSDRYAAMSADVVFAKDKLAAFCQNDSIPFTPYDTLATVAGQLERLRRVGPSLRPSSSGEGIRAL